MSQQPSTAVKRLGQGSRLVSIEIEITTGQLCHLTRSKKECEGEAIRSQRGSSAAAATVRSALRVDQYLALRLGRGKLL